MSGRLAVLRLFPLLLWLAACGRVALPEVMPDLSVAAVPGGEVVAWGYNISGATTVPPLPAGMTYTAVAGGGYHSLAVRSDGQVVAWGDNSIGQTDVPALPAGTIYTAVAGGGYHSLALRSDGQVVAWGRSDFGQTTVPALPTGTTYTAVAGGGFHSLALRSDGQVVAWGWNIDGRTDVPALPEGTTYAAVSGGGQHSLALRSDGQVVAWGYDGYGQTDVPAPPEGKRYSAVAGGGFYSLAIVVPKLSQSIAFTSTAPTGAIVGGSYTPAATATSGLGVTFGTSTPTTCTFSSGTVSFVGTGTCTVTAGQAGNASYNPASQATQSFTVSLPPVVADTYTIDLTTAPLNRILYSVKVGQGVTYSGSGTANPDPIRVDGYRYQSGKKLGGNQVKAIGVSGDNVLTVVKAGTNTPNPTGGELDIKPAQSFSGPSMGKNGLVTLKSITVDGVSTNGAKLVLYGNGQPIKTIALAKMPSQTLTLNEPNVGFIQVRANDSFTVDDVVFEVPPRR